MQELLVDENLDEIIQDQGALLVLFGGEHCNVCNQVKPKIKMAVDEKFPKVLCLYVDCEKQGDVCAQKGILSVPGIKIYFGGQMFAEFPRTFSIGEVLKAIERPYQLFFETD